MKPSSAHWDKDTSMFSIQYIVKWKWSRSVVSDSLWPHGLYLPGSSIHGIFQARLLHWVAISFSRGSFQPRDGTPVSCIAGRLFTIWATGGLLKWKWSHSAHVKSESEVAQSCPTLCDPMDCSPPGSSVHGILQARILEWVAISFSRGSSWSRDRTQVSRITGRHLAQRLKHIVSDE